ncbi:MAG TPA: hypothetical protein QF468_09855 [Nitrospinota bacterium]|nr:hypothetical protein [Nitrospinota bacterium]
MKKNKKIKKSSTASTGSKSTFNKKNIILILVTIIVISFASFFIWNQTRDKPVEIDNISSEDRQNLGAMILMVASNPDEFETIDTDFRDILKKYSPESGTRLVHLKEYMEGLFYLPKLFYEDAKKAIQEKRPFKSGERKRLEQHFLKTGFLTIQQIQNDEETMELIAKKKPIAAAHGVEIFIDEKRIDEMLGEWNDEEIKKIISELFTL